MGMDEFKWIDSICEIFHDKSNRQIEKLLHMQTNNTRMQEQVNEAQNYVQQHDTLFAFSISTGQKRS